MYIPQHCKQLTDFIPSNWQSVWIFFLEGLLNLERWMSFHYVKERNQHPEGFVLALCSLQNRRTNCPIVPIWNYLFRNFSTCRSPVTSFAYTNMPVDHQMHALLKNLLSRCSRKVITCSVSPWVSLVYPVRMSAFNVENVADTVLQIWCLNSK